MYLWQIMRCHVAWTVIYLKLRHPCMVRVCLWPLLYRYMQCRYLWYELRYKHLYWSKVTFITKVCVISKPNVNHVRTAVFHYLYTIHVSLWTPYTWYVIRCVTFLRSSCNCVSTSHVQDCRSVVLFRSEYLVVGSVTFSWLSVWGVSIGRVVSRYPIVYFPSSACDFKVHTL